MAFILKNTEYLQQILIKMEQSSQAALLRGVCNFVGDVLKNCVPTAFDSGRSGLNFIDLGEHCEPEQVAAYLQAAEDHNILLIFYLELTGGLREERNYFPSSFAAYLRSAGNPEWRSYQNTRWDFRALFFLILHWTPIRMLHRG